MKRLYIFIVAVIVNLLLSACTNGEPKKIDKNTLSPIMSFVVSTGRCEVIDPFMWASVEGDKCVLRLDRSAYPRVEGDSSTCDGLDLKDAANTDEKALNWVIKVGANEFSVTPRTHVDLDELEKETGEKAAPGLSFARRSPGVNEKCSN